MPGLSKVIVLEPDARACQQVQLGFEREGVPAAAAAAAAELEGPGEDTGLVVVGGVDGHAVELVRRTRSWLDGHGIDAPVVFAGRGVEPDDATAAGADEVVRHPAYLRDVVTIGRLLRGRPADQRGRVVGNLIELTGVFTLVRALSALGRSATLTLVRGLRRGEVRFYFGEVTSAQVGMIHGQAALHQLLLWTDARFDFHHEDVVRRQQIPLSRDELLADAERFLEGVRDSSGGLSPAMVLEQDVPRVQSLAKQIPTEVYGVLRMFDGHRTLADVLEDSAYRVFETLRVAQRAVEAGLIRVVDKPPPRPGWRTILAIEDWLVGGEPHDALAVNDARPATIRDARGAPVPQGQGAGQGSGQGPGKTARKRRKKKRRTDTPPAVAIGTARPREIDWGELVPRIVGAEVGPLAGVVPASHVSGEILTTSQLPASSGAGNSGQGASGPDAASEPTIVFDEAADLARDAEARRMAAERAAAEAEHAAAAALARAEAERMAAERAAAEARAEAEAQANAIRAVAATVSVSSEPARVIEDLELSDTKPERPGAVGKPALAPEPAAASSPAADPAAPDGSVIQHTAAAIASDAITAPIAAVSPANDAASPDADAAPDLAPADDSAPTAVIDEPSDGVVRHHITTAETAPVKRRNAAHDPRDNDRPGDTTGEITMPRARPPVVIRYSEPSILVPDLAAIQAEVGEHAPVQAAPAASGTVHGDAVFSDSEKAFFQAGHDKDAAAHHDAESFDDLDEGYRPVGFWERLTGRGKAGKPDKSDKSDKPTKKNKPGR